MAVSILFSCSKYNDDGEIIRDGNKSFYKEIFFGAVNSSKLNHVNDMIASRNYSTSKTVPDNLEEIIDILTENIDAIDPNFFIEFNRKIQSGDHVLIEEALNEGGEMLEQAMYATPELAEEMLLGEKIANEIDINEFLKSDGTLDAERLTGYIEEHYKDELAIISPTFVLAAAYVVAAVSVAVAVNYAGAVNVYVWFNAWKWTNAPKKAIAAKSAAGSSLQLEMLINDIATNYKK